MCGLSRLGPDGRHGASSLSPQHQNTTSTGQLDSHFPQIPSTSLYQQTQSIVDENLHYVFIIYTACN